MYEIKRPKRLSQARVYHVTARDSLCTDQRMSGLPMRATYKHFSTIEKKLLTIRPPPPTLPFRTGDHRSMV